MMSPNRLEAKLSLEYRCLSFLHSHGPLLPGVNASCRSMGVCPFPITLVNLGANLRLCPMHNGIETWGVQQI